MDKVYVCIDLKSFYASVECAERSLDPLTTNLVVADNSRTEKTICLAVSPSLKSYNIKGRARLFEVVQKVKEINKERYKNNNYNRFIGSSYNINELKYNNKLKLDYIVAKPRMSLYIKYSTDIYNVYLKYLSSNDILVYSIDEVFCDLTPYLKLYNLTARKLVTKIIHDIYKATKITATAGIGSNLYLAKIAMDIVAKKSDADKYGVRIATLDIMSYRKLLWNYRPLTSFWRIGKGISEKLENNNMYTMGDIARCSIENEDLLYKLFGVNAEILIDHAWGYEPCTIEDIKKYKPKNSSISTSQVLHSPYSYKKARIIVFEMAESLALSLTEKKITTNQIILNINYDSCNLNNYTGNLKTNYYGKVVPKGTHGSINLLTYTSSSKIIIDNTLKLFDEIVNKQLLIKRITICANNVINKDKSSKEKVIEQLDLFNTVDNKYKNIKRLEEEDNKIQNTILDIKNKYGKNSIIRVSNLIEGSTAIERNNQIGGHSA